MSDLNRNFLNKSINIKLLYDEKYQIPYLTNQIEEHFLNPVNCTKEILKQFDEGIYEDIIEDTDKVFLDIGANIGLFALHVHRQAERIICIEPTPSHFSLLKILTSAYPYIECKEEALSDHTGTTPFYFCPQNTTMNSLINRGYSHWEVDCLTLTEVLNRYNLDKVDFCKIDIEGSEYIALTEQEIKNNVDKIKKYYIEFHESFNKHYKQGRLEYKTIFEKCGYITTLDREDALVCARVFIQ